MCVPHGAKKDDSPHLKPPKKIFLYNGRQYSKSTKFIFCRTFAVLLDQHIAY